MRLSEAVDKGVINFDQFLGWFSPWTENLEIKIVDSFYYKWIKINNLPLHFWSNEAISKIMASFGEYVSACKNVIKDMLNSYDVRVLVQVKALEDIPKSIICSYKSQLVDFIREVKLEIIPLGEGQYGSETGGSRFMGLKMQGTVPLESP